MAQLILVLNPGSTSTKAAVYQDERPLLSRSIVHTNQDLPPTPPCTTSWIIGCPWCAAGWPRRALT